MSRRAALVAAFALLALAEPARAATWTNLTTTQSGSTVALRGAACVDPTHCWMVGTGRVTRTTDGSTWAGVSAAGSSVVLNAISCWDTAHCVAVGSSGAVQTSSDGGATWTARTAVTGTPNLFGVSCPTSTRCFAVGASGAVATSTDGGVTWSAQTSAAAQLNDISCPSATTCFAVGNQVNNDGLIWATSNGGTTWAVQAAGVGKNNLNEVSCIDATHCWTAGAAGVVASTSNGTSWSSATSPNSGAITGFDCAYAHAGTTCWAGVSKTVYVSTDGAQTWSTSTTGAANTINAIASPNAGRAYAGLNNGQIDQTIAACSSGGFAVSSPAITFPSTALNGRNRTITTSSTITADDETYTGDGWNLSATSTTFDAGSGHTLSTTATTITSGSSAAGTGNCSLPTGNTVTYPLTLPAGAAAPAAVKIFTAAANSGYGPADLTFNFGLAVPANAYAGSYSSTWTLTLATGP